LDLLIKNGAVVDGSGRPRRNADVAIADGRIVDIGDVSDSARHTIDASDLVVTPGFIDIHTHYDAAMFWDPLFTPSSWHGFTSVVMTNCGLGFAPCREGDEPYLMSLLASVEDMPLAVIEKSVPWGWRDFAGWMDTIDKLPKGINAGGYVGLSALRRFVMGEDCRRAANPDEISRIQQVAADALSNGALGISMSRFHGHFDAEGHPSPSAWASMDELFALAQALRDAGHGVFEMTPGTGKSGPGEDLAAVTNGMLAVTELARESGRPLTWASLRYLPSAPDRWLDVLEAVERAAADGVRLYPQIGFRAFDLHLSFSRPMPIFTPLETWRSVQHAFAESPARGVAMLERKDVRLRMRSELDRNAHFNGWQYLLVEHCALEQNKALEGHTIAHISDTVGADPLDVFLDLAQSEAGRTEFVYHFADTDEYPLGKLMQSSNVLFETDSSAHFTTLSNQDLPSYVLSHWVRENKRVSLEYAVHLMTGRPASVFGIRDRGMLQPGMRADVVVLDPQSVRPGAREFVDDLPGHERRLIRRAIGMKHVVVNGQQLMVDGDHTGAMPGQVIKGSRHGYAA
jgi:N-acyl-D-aspartate/D-glutamate deacylase